MYKPITLHVYTRLTQNIGRQDDKKCLRGYHSIIIHRMPPAEKKKEIGFFLVNSSLNSADDGSEIKSN